MSAPLAVELLRVEAVEYEWEEAARWQEYAEEDTPEELEQRDRARNSWRANEVALVAVHASLGL